LSSSKEEKFPRLWANSSFKGGISLISFPFSNLFILAREFLKNSKVSSTSFSETSISLF